MNENNEVVCVECQECKTLHRRDKETYIRVQGNIWIGQSEIIVGDNIAGRKQDGILNTNLMNIRSTYFCKECFYTFITKNL